MCLRGIRLACSDSLWLFEVRACLLIACGPQLFKHSDPYVVQSTAGNKVKAAARVPSGDPVANGSPNQKVAPGSREDKRGP